MLDKVENCFKGLASCLQIAKLYTTAHPRFEKFLDAAYAFLQDVLDEREEIIIGIVGEELAFEKEIFFELSKTIKPVILYLKERQIERIVFRRGLTKLELAKFITYLAARKTEVKKDIKEYLIMERVTNIDVDKIKALTQQELKDAEVKNCLGVYNAALGEACGLSDALLDQQKIDYLELRFTLTNVIEWLLTSGQNLLSLLNIKRYDKSTYNHSLGVSILAMYFSSRLGFSHDDILDIGIAALLHDVGKLYISRAILNKKGRLEEEEFEAVKSHVILGTEILLAYTDSIGILPAVAAFEHHLRYDLKGYPKLFFPRNPHIASLIVAICDVYDSLSQRRSYKNDYPPDGIYSLMMKEKGEHFAPELLDKFFKIMGVWPIGTVVSLNDGRIAVVREENEDEIFLPRVEVIVPREKREIIDLKEKKGVLSIEKFLNPWKEGGELLRLMEEGLDSVNYSVRF